MKATLMIEKTVLKKAKLIKLFVCDVDGILTDGKLYFSATGDTMKAYHVLDGLGLKLLKTHGVEVAIITSRQSEMVATRMEQLGIEHVYQGQRNKTIAFDQLISKLHLDPIQVAYAGDDLPDLALIRRVGLGITIPNAHPIIQRYADWMTIKSGGDGAVREICDLILKAQGKEPAVLEQFIS